MEVDPRDDYFGKKKPKNGLKKIFKIGERKKRFPPGTLVLGALIQGQRSIFLQILGDPRIYTIRRAAGY